MPVLLLAQNSPSPGYSVMLALLLFIAASVWLGTLAQKAMEKGKFLEGFFLGNRGLGPWALALTATVQSGGTFMGFPALVYAHGWIVALWIGGYMMVPLTSFAIVGKRIAQISRRTGAVTVPDLFRERFGSPAVGLVASLLIMFFMSFTMVAQFKAGATIMKLAWPGEGIFSLAEDLDTTVDYKYLIGLGVFSVTVVGYTMIGGFLASVWTDLFQSVMMVFGVVLLLILAVPAAGGLERANLQAVERIQETASSPAEGAGYSADPAAYMFGPGYNAGGRAFLPLTMAVSMFFMWTFAGFASPASLIRVMAAQSTEVMRKSIFLLAVYNCLIYVPLVVICICARAILGNIDKADEIIPRISLEVTQDLPFGSFLSGLILAAPFGAIMASVSCFVLVIASGLVQDIYVRFLRPRAGGRELRAVTMAAMIGVGLIAVIANLRPISFLQALVVFSGSAGAAAFVTPIAMVCYWRRATAAGMLASMLCGFLSYLALYATGWLHNWALATGMESSTGLAATVLSVLGPDSKMGLASAFRPYFLLGVDPIIWGMLVSAVAGVVVSKWTRPPHPELVSRMFDANYAPAQAV